MARAGVASRRDIERMIMEGRVSLNGVKLDTPVMNATLSDKIEVDGMPIRGLSARACGFTTSPLAGDDQFRPGRPPDRFRQSAG